MNELATINKQTQIEQAAIIQPALIERYIAFLGLRNKTTIKTYLNNLRRFFAWLQENNITRPTRENVLSYIQKLADDGKQPATINQYLLTLKQFFSWTSSEGIYLNVAANIKGERIKGNTHKKDNLKAYQVVKIENSIREQAETRRGSIEQGRKDIQGKLDRNDEQGKRLYAMFLLAVNAGLRTVEISRAKVKDLATKDGQTVLYIYGKGASSADTPKAIAPQVAAAIRDYLRVRSDKPTQESPLFTTTGNRAKGKHIATTTISTMLKQAMVKAGYDDSRLTAHSLRHTTAQAILEITNKNIYKTQTYLRHANPATTEIYLRESADYLNEQGALASDLFNHYHAAANV